MDVAVTEVAAAEVTEVDMAVGTEADMVTEADGVDTVEDEEDIEVGVEV